jgi:hypothetical protein
MSLMGTLDVTSNDKYQSEEARINWVAEIYLRTMLFANMAYEKQRVLRAQT